MITKPGKPPHLTSSYQPIRLILPSKIFEKVIVKRIETAATENNVIILPVWVL